MIRNVRALASERFDLLVIGGGIYGAWAARDAALRGFTVALVERNDWGAGTSSASSKLIHGGLRYLEHFWFRLVRTALRERELLARLGPHRVRPIRFVLPVDRGGRRGSFRLGAGLTLYDALLPRGSAWQRHRRLGQDELRRLCTFLSVDETNGGFEFGDGGTDDARFVLETVAGAMRAGAVAANHVEAVGLLESGGRVEGAFILDRSSGERFEVRARATLAAAGPWLAQRPFRDDRQASRIRLSKGVHLVLPALPGEHAVLLTSRADGRPVFVIPWLGRTLLGTTDTNFDGRAGEESVEATDIAYLLDETRRAFRDVRWTEADVLGSFAGLRSLRAGTEADPAAVPREWSLEEQAPGLIVSIGGKLTSARADAARAVNRIARILGRTESVTPTASQPFAWTPDGPFEAWLEGAVQRGTRLGLDPATARQAALRHGTRIEALHEIVAAAPAHAARITRDCPLCVGEIVHAARHEMAVTVEDILRRRVPVAILCQPDDPGFVAAQRLASQALSASAEASRLV